MTPMFESRRPAGLRTAVLCLLSFATACGFEPAPDTSGLAAGRAALCDLDAGDAGSCFGDDDGQPSQGPELNALDQDGHFLAGHGLTGAALEGVPLYTLRIEQGGLVAEQNGQTLRGVALAGAVVTARWVDPTTGAARSAEHRITAIQPELAQHDRAPSGATFLYTVERKDPATGAWANICAPDFDGNRFAIPVTGVWNPTGERSDSSAEFTFACTSGAIGKCYRWGYRTWVGGDSQALKDAQQACVRMARADYCGDGTPHTFSGTRIAIWDAFDLRTYQQHPGFVFEAGWSKDGAVCLSHARWHEAGESARIDCPGKLIRPGTGPRASVCDDETEAGSLGAALLFNASRLNVAH